MLIYYNILISLIFFFSFCVILCRNPIYSLFCLIMVFIGVSVKLFLFHVEFLSILLLIVYAGAISVLFLFVILLLNIKTNETAENQTALGSPFIFFILLKASTLLAIFSKIGFVTKTSDLILLNTNAQEQFIKQTLDFHSDVFALANALYTEYFIYLIFSSIILLIAMVGSLTLVKD